MINPYADIAKLKNSVDSKEVGGKGKSINFNVVLLTSGQKVYTTSLLKLLSLIFSFIGFRERDYITAFSHVKVR